MCGPSAQREHVAELGQEGSNYARPTCAPHSLEHRPEPTKFTEFTVVEVGLISLRNDLASGEGEIMSNTLSTIAIGIRGVNNVVGDVCGMQKAD